MAGDVGRAARSGHHFQYHHPPRACTSFGANVKTFTEEVERKGNHVGCLKQKGREARHESGFTAGAHRAL